MSLINRVEISNFLNIHDSNPWAPSMRHIVMNLRGQSTAVQMENGTGKTRIAEALLLILSRDKAFYKNTKKFMAPVSQGRYSHIRLEFITSSVSADKMDMFTMAGEDIAGRCWVFGVCGNSGENEKLIFYSYPGTLEMCPVALKDEAKIILIPNDSFKESLKSLKGYRWNSGADDWKNDINSHMPNNSIQQLVEYQKKGGGDKAASLYSVKPGTNEPYAGAFFRKVIAPEIMVDVMGEFAEDDEWKLEETLFKGMRSLIKARIAMQNDKKELEKTRQALAVMDQVVNAAINAENARKEFEEDLAKISIEASLLTYLITKSPLPGVLRNNIPDGTIGEILKHIVVVPGEGPLVLDAGIEILTGLEPKRVNEVAARNSINHIGTSQVVEITCDQFGVTSEAGRKHSSYTLDNAIKLLGHSNRFAAGLNSEKAADILNKSFAWFDDRVDTNPFRHQYNALKKEIATAEQFIIDRTAKLEETGKTLESEKAKKEAFSVNEAAYQEMKQSACFTEEELSKPSETADKVKKELDDAEGDEKGHISKKAGLAEGYEKWSEFKTKHGEANPKQMRDDLKTSTTESEEKFNEIFGLHSSLHNDLQKHNSESKSLKDLERTCKSKIEKFEELIPGTEKFKETFGDVSPAGLANKVTKDRDSLTEEVNKLTKDRDRYKELINDLTAFRGNKEKVSDPDQWLKQIETERNGLTVDLNRKNETLIDLKRQRQDLETSPVTASEVSEKALNALPAGLKYEYLYKVIDPLKLAADRKSILLTYFSALLFAPVVNNLKDAEKAANALHDAKYPIPVFLKDELIKFATSEISTITAVEGLAYTHLAGIRTRAVACIVDPSIVPQEIAEKDEQIRTTGALIAGIKGRLAEIGPESEFVKTARKASEAVKEKAEERIIGIASELMNTEKPLEDAKRKASADAIGYINAMGNFLTLGGETAYLREVGEAKRLESEIEGLSRLIEGIKSQLEAIKHDLETAKEAFNAARKNELETLPFLNQVIAFIEQGGPNFMEQAPEEEGKIKERIEKARKKSRFDFGRAQVYLDTSGEGIKALEKRIEDLKTSITGLKEEINQKEEYLGHNRPKVYELKDTAKALDEAISAMLVQYRMVASLGSDLGTITLSEKGFEDHDLFKAADALLFYIDKPDSTKGNAGWLRNAANELGIQYKAKDARRSLSASRKALEDYRIAKSRYLSDVDNKKVTGLSGTEIEQMKEAGDNFHIIKNLQKRISVTVDAQQSTYDKSAAGADDHRKVVTDGMTRFTLKAKDRLETLKKTLRSTPEATFEIDVTIASQEDTANLSEMLAERVEHKQKEYEEEKARGIQIQSEDEHNASLIEFIRETIYKKLFIEPDIHVKHPAIRGGHKFRLTADCASTGQKTALSFMIMAKLAEFSINRGTHKDSRFRKKDKVENFIIIDGLFSDLSNELLIDEAMQALKYTRGSFQLIGLIHNPAYRNNDELFPSFITGKQFIDPNNPNGKKGWISMEHARDKKGPVTERHIGEVGVWNIGLNHRDN